MDGVPSGVHWLVLWWHLQRLYAGLFDDEMEASLHAATRNGVVVELVGNRNGRRDSRLVAPR
ncbi:MAG: hypothetical protein HY557_01280 [Euryarchaeota archaeon]|nr:hypothetical protein [Euryarchaeota archaeon]